MNRDAFCLLEALRASLTIVAIFPEDEQQNESAEGEGGCSGGHAAEEEALQEARTSLREGDLHGLQAWIAQPT